MRPARVTRLAALVAFVTAAGFAPVAAAVPAGAAGTTTSLTAAQAKSILSVALRTSATRLLAVGGATSEYSYSQPPLGTLRTTVVIDHSGRRAQVVQAVTFLIAQAAAEPASSYLGPDISPADPCTDGNPTGASNDGYDTDATWTAIEQPGSGTLSKIGPHPTPEVSGGLKLLHRTGAHWVFAHNHSNSMTSIVEQQSALAGVAAPWPQFPTFDSGTQTTTASGTTDTLLYHNANAVSLRVALMLNSDDTIARAVDTVDVAGTEEIDEASFAYHGEVVALPAARAQITRPALLPGCTAIATRADAAELATNTASTVNTAVPRVVTPAAIRATIKNDARSWYHPHPGEQLDAVGITGGVEVVGRDRLLPHPTEWTVTVVHGRAVAHRIR